MDATLSTTQLNQILASELPEFAKEWLDNNLNVQITETADGIQATYQGTVEIHTKLQSET